MMPLEAAQGRCADETIVIEIPSLLLTPGDYHLNVGAHDNADPIDEVYNAAEFTVSPADVLGSGYHLSTADGIFVVPWDWELRPSSAHRVA
jgi:hypothetical protein